MTVQHTSNLLKFSYTMYAYDYDYQSNSQDSLSLNPVLAGTPAIKDSGQLLVSWKKYTKLIFCIKHKS